MGVKVHRPGSAAHNTIVFIMVSVVFYHIVISLGHGVSALESLLIEQFFMANKFLIFLSLLCSILIYRAVRFSKILFVVFLGYMIVNNLLIYFYSFDKIVLFYCFVYILASIYFFALWQQELEIVVYWPGYSKLDIGEKNSYNIPVSIKQLNKDSKCEGVLTNWGEFECFVYLNNSEDSIPKGDILLTLDFVGHKFTERGKVVTGYDGGIGVKFVIDLEKVHDGQEGWSDFFTIISHRGYNPRNVRV